MASDSQVTDDPVTKGDDAGVNFVFQSYPA